TALAAAAPAAADFSIAHFAASSSSSLAGGHPDLTAELAFSTVVDTASEVVPDGNVRDFELDLPPGLVGDPGATQGCGQTDFALNASPPAAQVGVARMTVVQGTDPSELTLPVFDLQQRNGEETAELAFSFGGVFTVHMPIVARDDGDGGLGISAS